MEKSPEQFGPEEDEKYKIDPELKEEINREGWEKDSEEGGAAVLVGKKEEVERLRERLETEGKTVDLGSYIRLHKEIILPHSEIEDNVLREKMLKMKGSFDLWPISGRQREEQEPQYRLRYVDKDGNLAQVNISVDDIAELAREKERIVKEVEDEFHRRPDYWKEERDRKVEIKIRLSSELFNILVKELKKMNFCPPGKDYDPLGHYPPHSSSGVLAEWYEVQNLEKALKEYKRKLERERAEAKKKEFDF